MATGGLTGTSLCRGKETLGLGSAAAASQGLGEGSGLPFVVLDVGDRVLTLRWFST